MSGPIETQALKNQLRAARWRIEELEAQRLTKGEKNILTSFSKLNPSTGETYHIAIRYADHPRFGARSSRAFQVISYHEASGFLTRRSFGSLDKATDYIYGTLMQETRKDDKS
jgi:hypothetical protein